MLSARDPFLVPKEKLRNTKWFILFTFCQLVWFLNCKSLSVESWCHLQWEKLPDFNAFPDLLTTQQDTRIFPSCWILIGQFKFPARQPYARLYQPSFWFHYPRSSSSIKKRLRIESLNVFVVLHHELEFSGFEKWKKNAEVFIPFSANATRNQIAVCFNAPTAIQNTTARFVLLMNKCTLLSPVFIFRI